jgi:hypothetical protein
MLKPIIRRPEKKPAPKPKRASTGTPEETIAEALRASGGFYSAAGKMLGITNRGVGYRVKRSPYLQEVVKEVKESLLDIAETQLLKHIKSGNMTALIFFLKCRGKDRGYIERSEIDQKITAGSGVLVVPGVAENTDAWLKTLKDKKGKEKDDESTVH